MADANIRKSSRIKARMKANCKNDDFESDSLIDQDVSTKLSNFIKSYENSKIMPSDGKKFNSCGRRIRRSQIMESSDENNHNISTNSESENFNAKEGEKSTGHHSQLQNGKSLICQICNIVVKSEKDLQTHTIEHNKSVKNLSECLVCDKCSRIFMDEKAYNRHMKSHTGNRKFKCDVCEKSFSESCSLKRHMKTHDNDRPFLCDLCFKSFRDSASLLRHQMIHTERQKMFHCSKCEKSFMDKHGLKRHERVHTGLRPYSCKVCQKSFSDSGSLKRHQKIHSGVKNYSCPRCKKRFLEKQSLMRHQKNVCGFVDITSFTEASSFDVDQSCDSLYSAAEHSEVSESSTDDKGSVTDKKMHSPKGLPVLIPSKMLVLPQLKDIEVTDVKSTKDLPSLHSLIKKDPSLYNSISEIVESIDSYEKMLHLCGDRGQNEIDAALAKDAIPLPDNLLCFECGELLVEGENFRSDGRVFVAASCHNSYKCLNCEDDYDYGDPPVLNPEVSVPADESLTPNSRCSKDTDLGLTYDTQDKNLFGGCESITDLRERLKHEHGVDFIGHEVNNIPKSKLSVLIAGGTVKPKSLAEVSRSHLELSKAVSKSTEDTYKNSDADFSQSAAIDNSDNSITMGYESDDNKIPTVFPCHLCTKVFASSTFLDQHLELHSKSPYKCMVCEKTFMNSPSLRRHMTMHTGEKPYPCPHCGKRFRDPSNFSKHKKVCATTMATNCCDSPNLSSQYVKLKDNNENFQADSKEIFTIHSPIPALESATSLLATEQCLKMNHHENQNIDDDEDDKLPLSFECNQKKSSEALQENLEECDRVSLDIKEEHLLVSCKVCNRGFKNEKYLKMHMSYHSGNPNVTCIECGKSFSDSFSLKRHARLHAGIRPHICEYCNRGYCDNWSLKKHRTRGCMIGELKVPADLLHPCPQCTRVFTEVHFLQEHMKSHKGLLKFECDICLKRFSEAFNLKRHRRLHMATCSGCEQEFKDIVSLTEHQKLCPANNKNTFLNNGGGYPCPMCGRIYSTKSYLERHKKFHSDLKPHVCEVCNKRFSEGFRLKRHMKVHSGTKPFTCDGCKKGFSDSLGLKRHKMSSACKYFRSQLRHFQQSETEYSCQICTKIFQKNYLLVRHMNVHSQERPFSCDICSKSYKDTSSLKRHQLVHGGLKNFICLVCGKGFYYSDSLKRHKSGSCGKKSKARRRGKSKAIKSSHNYSSIKYNNIKSEKLNSRIDILNELNKNATLSEQLIIAKDNLNDNNNVVVVKLVNEYPSLSLSAKKDHFRSLSHPKQAQHRLSKLNLYSRLAIRRHAKVCQKRYQCTNCFLSFTRKIYIALHYKVHNSDNIFSESLKADLHNL